MIPAVFHDAFELATSLLYEDVLVFALSRGRAWSPAPPLSLDIYSATAAPPAAPYAAADRARYAAGRWMLAVLSREGVPVSFAWYRVASRHYVREARVDLAPSTAAGWIVHCETPPEHRGRGYYPALISAVAAASLADHCYIYCVRSNVASRRGIEKAGFERVGTIRRRFGLVSVEPAFAAVTSRWSPPKAPGELAHPIG